MNLSQKSSLTGNNSRYWVVLDPANLTILFDPMTNEPWKTEVFNVAKIRAEDATALSNRKCIPCRADEAARHLEKGLRELAAKYGNLSLSDLNRIAQGQPPLAKPKK